MELKPKHELFVLALIKNVGNQTLAYQEVYPNANPESARHGGSYLWRKMDIRRRFSELLEAQGLGISVLNKKLKELLGATKIVKTPNAVMYDSDNYAQLQALLIAYRLHGLIGNTIDLTSEQAAEIERLIKEYKDKPVNDTGGNKG